MRASLALTLALVVFVGLSCESARLSRASRPFNGNDLANWHTLPDPGTNRWIVGTPALSPTDPRMLIVADARGDAMINLARRHGDSQDIYSDEKYGDCRIELEVMVPKNSNSGIYVMGEYEVQILDSWGRTELNNGDMGAVYGAAPPPVNACRPPGEWQKYVIDWRAPRFDASGRKIANAMFEKIELNGVVLHRNLEMPGPTPGGITGREAPTGPLMFQGNHGPVAYRNIKITPR
ncbi:DUF1080 domain-containing protein [bacterium]|nr:DUF1080 domain-containing protein [bacterium]